MEEQYFLDRCRLRRLLIEEPTWSNMEYAQEIGRSVGWVKKWCKRLHEAAPNDTQFLWGQSRARKTSPQKVTTRVVQRILEIRDAPPDNLQRRPVGPKTILYYLHRDEALKESGDYLPRSTATIWKILDAHHRIIRPPKPEHHPFGRPEPMRHWQMDFKDVTTVPPDENGKQLHMVEVFNVIDVGTSILVDARPHEDFNAATVIEALTSTFMFNGMPERLTFDRDPRFVGSAKGRDFPSALVRFLYTLGISVDICPPRRPDLNAFVERYHRTYNQECIRIHQPRTLAHVRDVTERFVWHYNHERPHQGPSCNNQPPFQAFPRLPRRPPLPDIVDPDAWLVQVHRRPFKRRVGSSGSVQFDKRHYYISRKMRGRYVLLTVDAHRRQFDVAADGKVYKHIPIKGLIGEPLDFQDYLRIISKEAIAEWRLYTQPRLKRRVTM